MNDLAQRIVTGIILVGSLVVAIRWSPGIFALIFFVLTIIALLEFSSLLSRTGAKFNKTLLIISSLGLYGLIGLPSLLQNSPDSWIYSLAVPFVIPLIQLIFTHRPGMSGAGYTLTAMTLIGIPFGLLNLLNPSFGDNPWWPEEGHYVFEYLLGFFIALWTHDSFAYITGKLLGKNKLAPVISPNKTWEGSVGGMTFAVLAGILIHFFIGGELVFWIIGAILIGIGSTFGDLGISALKRRAKAKDTGTVLPGHGGVLDRMDGVLIASPLFYTFINIWTQLS